MANPCVFCGDDRNRLSDEHALADWISDLFPAYPAGVAQLVGADDRVRRWAQVPFQQRLKIVCVKCNTGWMSRLEAAAKPFLTPMLLGQRQELRPRTQKLLAFWAVKTALVIDHFHPKERVVPDSEYRALYTLRSPLPSHLVWLGRLQSMPRERAGDIVAAASAQAVTYLHSDSDSRESIIRWASEGRKLYRITFRVGHLVVQ